MFYLQCINIRLAASHLPHQNHFQSVVEWCLNLHMHTLALHPYCAYGHLFCPHNYINFRPHHNSFCNKTCFKLNFSVEGHNPRNRFFVLLYWGVSINFGHNIYYLYAFLDFYNRNKFNGREFEPGNPPNMPIALCHIKSSK